ncbi:MAG: MFS transporter, partial [Aeromonas sp.]|nr:MFS transporter [Aeromonas sp.]
MVERARRLGRWFLALDSLLVILGFFVVMPMISLRFVDQLGWAAGVVGLALGLRQLTQQGLGVLGGSLADKFGARPLIVGGMLLRAAGFASLAYAQSGLELILSCIISGLGGCLFDPPRAALVIKFTRPRQRGRYISLLMMLESAGAVVGALLGSWLLNFDFEYVCLLGAGLFVCAALCNLLILPPYKLSQRPTPIRAGLGQVLADKAFCRLVLILSGYYALWVQVMLIFPILVKQMAGTTTAVGWMYTLETAISLTLLYPLA